MWKTPNIYLLNNNHIYAMYEYNQRNLLLEMLIIVSVMYLTNVKMKQKKMGCGNLQFIVWHIEDNKEMKFIES